MDIEHGKQKGKKNLILKTWERCQSIGSGNMRSPSAAKPSKSKSWHYTTAKPAEDENSKRKTKCRVAPDGCFSVYVGPEKQRFVIKTEFANHPSFKMLLEDAELEYGYNSEGPITLPCDVDLFIKVLADIESGDEIHPPAGCGFVKGYGSFSLLSPCRRQTSGDMAKNCGSYGLLTPSRLLKMHQF
ncbi:hypothetical protein L1049_027586 [Liquidambar formosana]|uniref:Small auxin up regulated protein n=1 Tax=Liquidambar formosana TaxID=63359 RepID=A0AAP0RHZ6_LIQFO